jgi:ribosome maturation factor RimP
VKAKGKYKQSPFNFLLGLYVQRIDEIAQEMGQKLVRVKENSFFAGSQLRWVIESPEVTSAMAVSMTSLVMTISIEKVDKPDPVIARYALEFAVENRLAIVEAVLTI